MARRVRRRSSRGGQVRTLDGCRPERSDRVRAEARAVDPQRCGQPRLEGSCKAADERLMEEVRAIRRTLLRVAIFALCVSALVGIAAVLSARLDQTEEQILLTHVAIAVYSFLALAAATVAKRHPRLAAAGWCACGSGLLLALV